MNDKNIEENEDEVRFVRTPEGGLICYYPALWEALDAARREFPERFEEPSDYDPFAEREPPVFTSEEAAQREEFFEKLKQAFPHLFQNDDGVEEKI